MEIEVFDLPVENGRCDSWQFFVFFGSDPRITLEPAQIPPQDLEYGYIVVC